MACSKPIVAFDVSSNPEIISNGSSGFLVKPYDIEQIVEKILLLHKNEKLREQMGIEGRQRVKEFFDYNKTVEQVSNIIQAKPNQGC